MSGGQAVESGRTAEEPRLEASRSKAVLWMLAGLVVIVGVGLAAVTAIGGSVMYYKTPSELVEQRPAEAVRLAGKLVPDSPKSRPDGAVSFAITDGETIIQVVYRGGATTALTSAARPGATMVAEGTLGPSGTFEAVTLLAKCPSKFTAAKLPDGASASATT